MEAKIKVNDLAAELDMPRKEVLRALREMGVRVPGTNGSVDAADVQRLRDHLESRKAESVQITEVQPNVIVRRRRKDQADAPESQPRRGAGPEGQEVASELGHAPAPESYAADDPASADSPADAPESRQEAEKTRSSGQRVSRKALRNVGARIISKPGEQSAPEEVAAAPLVEEKPRPVSKKPVREGPTLAQMIRQEEAAKREKAQKEAQDLKASLARGAKVIVPPAPETPPAEVVSKAVEVPDDYARDEVASAKPVEEAPHVSEVKQAIDARDAVTQKEAQKSQRHSRGAAPDASAAPTGSSAPTLGRKGAAPAAKPDTPPQVRVISRPAAPAPRRAAASAGRPGDRAGYRGGEQRPGAAPRPQRPGAPKAPGFGAPQSPRGGQPIPPQNLEGRDGQSKKKRLKGRRTVDFQQGDFGRHGDEDDGMRLNRGRAKRKNAKAQTPAPVTQPIKAAKRKIRVDEAIRLADMAHQMGVKANEIIKVLFGLGVMATINQAIDLDTATVVAAEFGYEVEKAGFSEEDYLAPKEEDAPESLRPRPPVVTIMGHVDHGKTSLLDAVRKSNVTGGEAGGITQHIGAYHVKTRRGEIVFLDTPGHEAFTAMRARGAQITDLVILVVAADDGVMEQTREAISHSKAANVPIVVAVNKMDKPAADPDRVLRELAELGLQPEDWGGDTIVAKVSAKTREGLDDLLELVALQSEIMDLKANPDKPARGHIVEAKLDKGRGPVATVLIQEGTLKPGDNFVCGSFSGRVRALTNDQGKKVREAGPSMPVEVQGFDGVPEAGEEFMVVTDDKVARRIADSRAIKRRERDLASESRVTLETFLAHANEKEALTLNLVLKADVQGSLEAISEALRKLSTDKVRINIVHGGAGAISESDILLASASQAIVVGFNVRPTSRIKDIAEKENVDIRYYDIIYKLADDVKSAMAGMLAPVQKEVYLGQAEVRQVYNLPRIGAIAGSYVADGKVARNAGARILRDGVVVYTGKISSLKRFKDDAREVVKGNECGIGLENFNDIKVGDIIETFETVEEAATL